MKSNNVNSNKLIFDEMSKNWNQNIPLANYKITGSIIDKFGIEKDCSVLDVACGTGILYSSIEDRNLARYVGIDISQKMIGEFINNFPHADVRQADFESKVLLEITFDYIIIFNSIPHFNNLEAVFENAYNNLNSGGTFIIAHSRTREGLKEHHRKIGHVPDRKDPIPRDELLLELSKRYKFSDVNISDEDYFCFSCKRK